MQTTLLGIAIALILALVTALVGPLLVDWGRYRLSIEAEASRLVGAPVRIAGPIEGSLLPSPSLKLRDIEIGPSHAGNSIRMRSLGVELSLGSMMRGQWRAAELHLVGPTFNLSVDSAGQIALPPVAPGFDPDRLSIDRLNIEDGYVVLADARSGSRLTLDKLWFNGDMRSLAGPFKGDGAFVIAGDLYAYRIAAGRAEDGAINLRLNVDPLERPLAVEAEGVFAFAASPRFEGALTLSRPAGVALRTGQTVASDPWRLATKVKASASSALLEGLEFQYGPEERAVKLNGTAELTFGDKPRFDGVLSAAQLDLDRAFAAPNTLQLPFAALKTLSDSFSGALRPSIPARLGVSIDTLTLAGSTVSTVRGDLRSDGQSWNLEGFELRVPGFTQINLSGRLDLAAGRLGFTGPVSVDSTDPTALVAWLEGNAAPLAPRMKPFRARGEVTLGSEKIAFERLSAEIDRKWVEGRLAYAWASGDQPARLDADLNAADLDIDKLLAFADSARGTTTFETPREVTLGLGIGRALVAGVEASNVSARFRRDASGLHVERLSIGDFGGAAFEASGRIDATALPPQGTMSLHLDARNLGGVVALADKFIPEAAGLVRRIAHHAPSARLDATLALQPAGAAKLTVEGRSGDVRVMLRGETARHATDAARDLQSLAAAEVKLGAKFESDKGTAVLDLLNLDGLVAADPARPGQLSLTAMGRLANLELEGRLLAGGLDASAKGMLRLAGDQPKADLRLTVATADARGLRSAAANRPVDPFPVSLTGNLAITGHSVTLQDFSGAFAGIPARGRIGLDFEQTTRVEGQIEADAIDGAAALAAFIGMPASDSRSWPSEPFGRGVLSGVEGRIEFKTGRATITPNLVLRQARGTAKFGRAEIALMDIDGYLADGRAKGQLVFHKSNEGLSARGSLRLVNADAAALLGRDSHPPVTGRVTLQLDLEGAGLSPQALIGSLAGNGLVSLSQAEFAALNAKVFETATRAVDAGAAVDMKKIGDIAGSALESGALTIPSAEGIVTVSHGQIRLTNLVTRAEGAELTVAGSVDLMEQNLSARLSLTGDKDAAKAAGERPAVSIFLTGPLNNPKRSVDVSALTTWLTLRGVEQQSKQLEAIEAKRRLPVGRPDEPRTTSSAPDTQRPAPPLPRAIEVPTLPGAVEQKPARAPARTQSGTAAQPRPVPQRPLPLLPGAN